LFLINILILNWVYYKFVLKISLERNKKREISTNSICKIRCRKFLQIISLRKFCRKFLIPCCWYFFFFTYLHGKYKRRKNLCENHI